jgi:hypothetical protein
LVKAWYGPATEELWDSISTMMILADIEEDIATAVIDALKAKGYSITIEVEVHGDMAKALESLGGDTSDWKPMKRPERKT